MLFALKRMLEPVKRYGKIFISLKVNDRTFSWLKSNRLSLLTSWGAYKEGSETPVPKKHRYHVGSIGFW